MRTPARAWLALFALVTMIGAVALMIVLGSGTGTEEYRQAPSILAEMRSWATGALAACVALLAVVTTFLWARSRGSA